MSSIIEYQWIKVYIDQDGIEKFIPQFRSDGTQQFWHDTAEIHPTKLLIAPISIELANRMQEHKIPGVAIPLPVYSFLLKSDDIVSAYWDNAIETSSHYFCTTCNTSWKHLDSTKWAKCPQCGEMDAWTCLRCGRTIENTKVLRNQRGEINCPHCEIPYGLTRERRLERIQDITENTDYVVEVANKFKITIRQNSVDVISL